MITKRTAVAPNGKAIQPPSFKGKCETDEPSPKLMIKRSELAEIAKFLATEFAKEPEFQSFKAFARARGIPLIDFECLKGITAEFRAFQAESELAIMDALKDEHARFKFNSFCKQNGIICACMEDVKAAINSFLSSESELRQAGDLVRAEFWDAQELQNFRRFCSERGSEYSNVSEAEELILKYYSKRDRKILDSLVKKGAIKDGEREAFLESCRAQKVQLCGPAAIGAAEQFRREHDAAEALVRSSFPDREERKTFRRFCKEFRLSCCSQAGVLEAVENYDYFFRKAPVQVAQENAPVQSPAETEIPGAPEPANGKRQRYVIENGSLSIPKLGVSFGASLISEMANEHNIGISRAQDVVLFLVEGLRLLTPKPSIGNRYFNPHTMKCNIIRMNPEANDFNGTMKWLAGFGVLKWKVFMGKGIPSLDPHTDYYSSQSIAAVVRRILEIRRERGL